MSKVKSPRTPILSVRQPWAELIVAGVKVLEYRTWLSTYRGPLLIHAGTARDPDHPKVDGPRGAVVGVVELVEVLDGPAQAAWLKANGIELDGPTPAPFAWRLESARRLEPIEARGRLGLWYSDHVERGYRDQLRPVRPVCGSRSCGCCAADCACVASGESPLRCAVHA